MRKTVRSFDISQIPGLDRLEGETKGESSICIAILDGPVDQSHPSLAFAHLGRQESLVSGIADQGPSSRHGTHITSIIFGQDGGPVKGVAPNCRGLIIPIFKDDSDGSIAPCSQVDLARAISQAVQGGAHIINISGGEWTPTGSAHSLLADAVRDCADRGVLIVAAAGNQGCECLHIPGALPSVLTVGAMNADGTPLEFSNWGEKYRMQGILAPGENILGAVPFGDTALGSGTSYATAVVTGIVALFLSLQFKLGGKPDPHGVKAAILDSAIGCEEQPTPNCSRLLAGRLNIKGAQAEIISKGGFMANTIEQQESPTTLIEKDVRAEMTDEMEAAVGVYAASPETNNPGSSDAGVQEAATSKSTSHTRETVKHIAKANGAQVNASGCGCDSESTRQLVFALGQLGYNFGNEASRDSIMQHMESPDGLQIPTNPNDPAQLLAYLAENPWDAESIIWTLHLDTTPVYAIRPRDAFATETYQRLREFLSEQTNGQIERISVGGIISGSARLSSGQVVPVIYPSLRCMYSWNTAALLGSVTNAPSGSASGSKKAKAQDDQTDAVRNFLERVYHELRNLGIDPCQRAINYSATNALNISNIFESAIRDNMQLDTIECEPSPLCRPGSDCWDVKLIFFDPENQLTRARKVYRFTVDVSDVCPVMVGDVRLWSVR
jgi:cyanobactin maturation PatA/PatG family protease